MRDGFDEALIALLPKLRVQALALTRDRTATDDLVQETVRNALAARASFRPGTNLAAWLRRILKNQFITDLRRKRPNCGIDDAPEAAYAVGAGQGDALLLEELSRALGRLPSAGREALVMLVVHEMSYERIAEATGCAVGTAKSRVHRARLLLRSWLIGDDARLAGSRGTMGSPPEGRVGRHRRGEGGERCSPLREVSQ